MCCFRMSPASKADESVLFWQESNQTGRFLKERQWSQHPMGLRVLSYDGMLYLAGAKESPPAVDMMVVQTLAR